VNIFLLPDELPKNCSMFNYRVEVGKINGFGSVSVAGVKHIPSYIT
jgi:hypothetical protein